MLHPDYPVVEGEYRLTNEWSVVLPEAFNRRFEGEQMVLWRPGFTIWLCAWMNNHRQSREERISADLARLPAAAYDVRQLPDDGALKLQYRLDEESDDERQPAFYSRAYGFSGHIQMSIYFDEEEHLEIAERLLNSLVERHHVG